MTQLNGSLASLFSELINGAPTDAAYMLNGGDRGLLRSLDDLSAVAASTPPASGGAPIAAHIDHVRYGFELLNGWQAGEDNPWADADWTTSWRRTRVNDEEWKALRASFRDTVTRWHAALQAPRKSELSDIELNGVIGSLAHLAYHFGAIRQIDRSLRGPSAS